MKLLLLLACVGVACSENTFEEWMKLHGKQYDSFWHHQYRKEVWTQNMNEILQHNIRYMKGESTFRMAMNRHGDLTAEEFASSVSGLKNNSTGLGMQPADQNEQNHAPDSSPFLNFDDLLDKDSTAGSYFLPPASNYTPPDKIDFRDFGYVTGVKDEFQCIGSCWAFSTIGSLEGQLFRKTGKLVSLSEQQLIDCSWHWNNAGCNGGRMDYAFQYLMDVGGSESEAAYPYEKCECNCKFDHRKVVGKPHDYIIIPQGNETLLTTALALNGPISIALDANHKSFQFYAGGIYIEPRCSKDPNHMTRAATVVGYGTNDYHVSYYIVKNSLGKEWGEEGYIRMLRDGSNQCGVANFAIYPVV